MLTRPTIHDSRLTTVKPLLAADVGGTKTLIGLFERAPRRPLPLERRVYDTQAFGSFSAILDAFETDLTIGGIRGFPRLTERPLCAPPPLTQRRTSWQPRRLVFNTVGPPDTPPPATGQVVRLTLDPSELDEKITAALGFTGLEEETQRTLAAHPRETFALECLFPEDLDQAARCAESPDKPYYETYGRQQVAHGLYGDVIQFNEHILPLKRALFDGCISPT